VIAVRFLPAAREGLLAAVAYYEERQSGLGARLNAEVEHAIATIIGYPATGSPFTRNARRVLLNRFPYGVVYRASSDEIVGVAVPHRRRRPGYWRRRT
jgi:plasmid stabilization system protein ParE